MSDFDFQTADLGKPTLIEASAGTGKTFVLERLLERLLTEPWNPETAEPLQIQKILVVTYTEKATQELRLRIHNHLKMKLTSPSVPDSDKRFLKSALLESDLASIHTLHAFCQKLLGEFALNCGADFKTEVGGEEALVSLIQDGFRSWENTSEKESLKAFLGDFTNRESAEHFLLKLLRSEAVEAIRENPPSDWFRCVPDRQSVLKWLSVKFSEESSLSVEETFKALQTSGFTRERFEHHFEQSGLPKKKYNKNVVANVIEALESFPRIKKFEEILALHELLRPFSKDQIREKAGEAFLQSKNADWLFWIGAVSDFVKACETYRERGTLRNQALICDFLFRFLSEVSEAFRRHKAEQNRLSYDDMIRKVHEAVVVQNRQELIRGIRDRYRAVLLDEFQDTDRRQWEIFEKIFLENPKPGPFFLVGDPKQAIYRFRGADLPVYFDARSTLNHSFPLSVNHRSHPDLLEGLNRLFLAGPLFPDTQPIRYAPSRASVDAHAKCFFENGTPSPPIEFLSLPKNKAGASRTLLYEYIAQTLVRFLSPESGFRLGNQKIRSKDVAILTRTNQEARSVSEILLAHGIPCLIASPESLWQSEEARDLEIFLNAVANPADEVWVQRALLTCFFDLDSSEILHFSEKQREQHREQFWKWRDLFNATRLSQALSQAWNDLSVFPKQLAKADGDGTVTHLTHLLEKIIEQENETFFSPEEWSERLRDLRKQDEGKEPLRLETDEEAVPILTIHKSKGLEFPIVFLAGGIYKKNLPLKTDLCHYSDEGKKVFDLCASREGREKALEEQESEYRRLVYVAMTRAKSKLFLPLFPKSTRSESLVNLLWNPEKHPDPLEFISKPENKPYLTFTPVNQQEPGTTLPPSFSAESLFFKESLSSANFRHRSRPWTSFSSLTRDTERKTVPESLGLFPAMDEWSAESQVTGTLSEDFSTLPKGPETGNLLHQILETLPFQWIQAHASLAELEKNEGDFSKLNALLQRALRRHSLPIPYLPALRHLLWNALKTSLPGTRPFTLSGVTRRKHEMEFVLAVHPRLKTLLTLHTEEQERLEFRFDMDAFFLRGFVDLVFEQDGKYYVADWKSNHLGNTPEAYTQGRMLESIREHRYFLQYALYATALCLFLKKQNPDFSYEKDFGGVFYFYLRGMKEGDSTGIFFHKPGRDELRRFGESFLRQGFDL